MKLKQILLTGMFGLSLITCKFPEYDYMKRDGYYNGVVVFVGDEGIATEATENEIMNNLKDVPIWYERQAQKYGRNIEITLEKYPNDFPIPQSFNITDYLIQLRQNPELSKYDFIALEYPNPNPEGRASPSESGFYVNSMSSNGNVIFAHEFAHLLGATDKTNSDDIMDSKGVWVDSWNSSEHNYSIDRVTISSQTAKEIGW